MRITHFLTSRAKRQSTLTLPLALSLAAFAGGALPAAGGETAPASPAALIKEIKKGGHVLYLRHGSTETDYADQIDATMGDCASQRVLSEAGWAEVKEISAAFRALEIPVGDVFSSEYCRAWQSADLAFGHYEKTDDLNFERAETYTDAQTATMRANVSPHLSAVPKSGNTILVGHDDPFEAATGIYPEPMGVLFVVKPDGADGFKVIGSIAPDDWKNLR